MPTLLIVDDSDDVRRFLRKLVSETPHWTACGFAENGVEAVAMAQQFSPDVVILDLSMPVLDGLRAAPQILKVNPNTAIVLYTMHYTKQLEQDARAVGIKRVLSKTEDAATLLKSLDDVFRDSQLKIEGTSAKASTLISDSAKPATLNLGATRQPKAKSIE
jgi:two-component system, chemotaxis family, chemotaxis protein CheY